MQFVCCSMIYGRILSLADPRSARRAQREMCGCTSATKNNLGLVMFRVDIAWNAKADSHRGHGEHRGRQFGTSVFSVSSVANFVLVSARRSIASRRAQAAHAKEKIWTSGLPSGCRGRFLIVEKKVFWPRAGGTRSHDAAGQHRHLTNQARFVRSTLPPSPGPPVEAALPIRHPAMRRFYRPARASAVHARSTAGKGRDAGTYATSAPVVQEKTTTNLNVPLGVQQHQPAIAQSESARRDCPRTTGLISRSVFLSPAFLPPCSCVVVWCRCG